MCIKHTICATFSHFIFYPAGIIRRKVNEQEMDGMDRGHNALNDTGGMHCFRVCSTFDITKNKYKPASIDNSRYEPYRRYRGHRGKRHYFTDDFTIHLSHDFSGSVTISIGFPFSMTGFVSVTQYGMCEQDSHIPYILH